MKDPTAMAGANNKQTRVPFARFGAAVGLANLGDGIAVVAWAWTASLLARDPFWIAILPAALRVPWVLFALPSGVLADRLRSKTPCRVLRPHPRRRLQHVAGAAIFLSLPPLASVDG